MSSDRLNVILISSVTEQEYVPFKFPESLCVFKEGVKGFSCNVFKVFISFSLVSCELLAILDTFRMNRFSNINFGKLLFPVSYRFHSFFYCIKR